ncbi:hypothetical protein SPRG_09262 [Saprolegnia parasitica CBS 223.65]|uniref:Uncharacterized protein n=1 Tax=Saprolegnia parasitica (strain CBS 223.65) TaxID=695850 RepID=A0A067C7H0_SAPPC|nr:hypothetical protein SPRG_09262 [Saprolegnia parasitica CBS 223.65]KDO25115.1 hypothetical protein SPRG_09262 [Saprolegnia parasitica CBS 223.65]|eukprot:XP_012204185.1 hypothetical protein SPRG_09262 [Saprolegnia parasitica CBS 223.65]
MVRFLRYCSVLVAAAVATEVLPECASSCTRGGTTGCYGCPDWGYAVNAYAMARENGAVDLSSDELNPYFAETAPPAPSARLSAIGTTSTGVVALPTVVFSWVVALILV